MSEPRQAPAGGARGTRTVDLRGDPDADLAAVAAHVASGGLIAYPTETVYGLGGACTADAVERVRRFKGRAADRPFIALVASAESVSWLEWTGPARELAGIFWPGSLTLVLRDPEARFPAGVRDDRTGTVGIRVSPHPVAARLLARVGAPLISTSLNLSGDEPVRSGHDAERLVRRREADDVWVLDAGTLPPSGPSTVVDCTGAEPVVLREGAVPIGRLRCAIPGIHGHTD